MAGCHFDLKSLSGLYEKIISSELEFPENNPPPDNLRSLFMRILERSPKKRITMGELRELPWVTHGGEDPLLSVEENTADCITPVTEEDLRSAIERIQGVMDADVVQARLQSLHGWRGKLNSGYHSENLSMSRQSPSRFEVDLNI